MPADNLRGVNPKSKRDLLRRASKAGAEVTLRRGGHVKITGPNGIVFTGGTSSSWGKAEKNLADQIRNAGIDI